MFGRILSEMGLEEEERGKRDGRRSESDELTPLSRCSLLSRFRLEKGTESTALSNCLIVNDLDFGGAQYVRVNRQFFLAVK